MMRAKIESVDGCTFLPEEFLQPFIRLLHEIFIKETFGDARLVRDDDGLEAADVDQPDGFIRLRDDPEPVEVFNVTDFFVDGSVTVQEYGAFFLHGVSTFV